MIRFDHITKQYPGTSRPALNSIDVEILRGEFVFLVGASGSGKSSCLRLILKEERPTSGSIHVLGQDLRAISNRKVPYFRRNLGVVFQDFRLLPNKSVYDNVAFSLQVIGKSRGFIQEAVPDTLTMVGLAEKAQRLPHELSGGEQQRVAIARAIVNKPQILLADEPTGNLDPTTSAGIMALLDSINAGGTTVVMATHEAGIVDQMQRRVIELSAGEIIRDERRGGYTTSAIPIITTTQAATAEAPGDQSARAHAARTTAPVATAAPATGPVPATVGAAAPAVPRTTVTAEMPPTTTAATVIVTPTPEPAGTPVTAAAAQTGPVMPPRFAPPQRDTHGAANVPDAPEEPLTHPPAAVSLDSGMPLWEPPRSATPAPAPAPDATTAPTDATGPDPDFDPERPMTRPILRIPQHDEPEQLTLAEKLGLRAPGEKSNPTGEQNVGPTR